MSTARLSSPRRIREIMAEHGLRFTKALGQNFLIDANLVRKIGEIAQVGSEDVVLEVGPGIGTLTEELLDRAGLVIAIELDRTFIPVLQELFGDRPNFLLIQGDALTLDLRAIFDAHASGRSVHVVANVPYYITTPLLERFLDPELGVQSVTVLVQKEVAVRMTSEPGSKDYGALTLLIALHGQAALRLSVPHQAFLPPPKVDSAVVRIEMPSRIALSGEERQQVNAVIRRIFQQRRKMMARTLQAATGAPIGEIREALQQEGIQGSARPEQVSLEQLVHILQRIGYINGRNRIE